MPAPHIIVGGGLAAARAAEAFREAGYAGELLVLTAEDHVPYERPPLSKGYLQGNDDRTALASNGEDWYAEKKIEVRRRTRVIDLDPQAHTVTTEAGEKLEYATVVLATGSTARPLPYPGADLAGVHTLRSVEDSEALRTAVSSPEGAPATKLVVIGDGWIGLEAAASARSLGAEVTVLGRGATPLAALGARLGSAFAALHVDNGVNLRSNTSAEAVLGPDGRVTGVRLAGGEVVEADVVLVGIGAFPNTGLAVAAGLDIDATTGGIAVDARLESSAKDVYAVGDVAAIPSVRYGGLVRTEHWANAFESGAHAAKSALGADEVYDQLPYFFSDQFDSGLESWGAIPREVEPIISGDLDKREAVAFWVEGSRVSAALALNVWDRGEEIEAIVRAENFDEEALKNFVG